MQVPGFDGMSRNLFSHADDGAIRYHPRRAGKPASTMNDSDDNYELLNAQAAAAASMERAAAAVGN